jgi:DNA-binding beta-propeller fold protein YncE
MRTTFCKSFIARIMSGSLLMGAALAGAPAAAQTPLATRAVATRDVHAPVLASPLLAELARASHGKAAPTKIFPGPLDYPYGLAVDSAGNLYVANLFAGVSIFSAKTHLLTGTITAGTDYPAAVGISFEGNIFVANNGGDNITIYNPALQQIGTISDPTLYSPSSLYIDADDDVWALDATGTLHLYLANGASAGSVAIGGTAVGPWGSNVTVWGAPDGAGGYNEFTQNRGEALHNGPTFPLYFYDGSPEAGAETQDALGQQYVTDVANNRVQIWSANGQAEIAAIPTPAQPFGVAVDNAHGRIYVALTTSNEVVAYSTKAPFKLLFTIQ